MIEYSAQNKEWIFSGIGVVILFEIVRWAFKRKRQKKIDSHNKFEVNSEQLIKVIRTRAKLVNQKIDEGISTARKNQRKGFSLSGVNYEKELAKELTEFREKFNDNVKKKTIALRKGDIVVYHELNIQLNQLIKEYDTKVEEHKRGFEIASTCHQPSMEMHGIYRSIYSQLSRIGKLFTEYPEIKEYAP